MKVLTEFYKKQVLGRSILCDEGGQTVLEYILVIALVSVVFILAFQTAMMNDLVITTAEKILDLVSGAISSP